MKHLATESIKQYSIQLNQEEIQDISRVICAHHGPLPEGAEQFLILLNNL